MGLCKAAKDMLPIICTFITSSTLLQLSASCYLNETEGLLAGILSKHSFSDLKWHLDLKSKNRSKDACKGVSGLHSMIQKRHFQQQQPFLACSYKIRFWKLINLQREEAKSSVTKILQALDGWTLLYFTVSFQRIKRYSPSCRINANFKNGIIFNEEHLDGNQGWASLILVLKGTFWFCFLCGIHLFSLLIFLRFLSLMEYSKAVS